MIIVRNDDVILDSGGKYKGKEFERFRFVHEQISSAPDLVHCPAILCQEIEAFPEAIEYIRAETAARRMRPYLHCWNHDKNWTTHSTPVIEEMLKHCDSWFEQNLDCEFHVWATPWGATSPMAIEAAGRQGIRLETTHPTIDFKAAAKLVKDSNTVRVLYGRTILYHWWMQGLAMFRISQSSVHGSWTAAAAAKPEWF